MILTLIRPIAKLLLKKLRNLEEDGEWIELKDHEDYEIFNREPFSIRRKGSDKPIVETFDKSTGYYCCTIDKQKYLKHRLIAIQFIPNPNPSKFKYIDHVSHDKTDIKYITPRVYISW